MIIFLVCSILDLMIVKNQEAGHYLRVKREQQIWYSMQFVVNLCKKRSLFKSTFVFKTKPHNTGKQGVLMYHWLCLLGVSYNNKQLPFIDLRKHLDNFLDLLFEFQLQLQLRCDRPIELSWWATDVVIRRERVPALTQICPNLETGWN